MDLSLNKCSLVTVVTTLTIAATTPAEAIIINGGFETENFTGWDRIGTTSIQTAAFGTGPVEGRFQALLTTSFGSVSDQDIENFLNLSSGSLDALNTVNTIEGSAISQTFEVQAGQTLSFQWNFLTDEFTPAIHNDLAFVSIAGVNGILADTNSTFVLSSSISFEEGGFFEETGYKTFSTTFIMPGTIKLGVGVLDGGDHINSSGLLIDDVHLTPAPPAEPVPEPLTILSSLTALAVGTVMKKKASKKVKVDLENSQD